MNFINKLANKVNELLVEPEPVIEGSFVTKYGDRWSKYTKVRHHNNKIRYNCECGTSVKERKFNEHLGSQVHEVFVKSLNPVSIQNVPAGTL